MPIINFKKWLIENELIDDTLPPEEFTKMYKKARRKYAVPSLTNQAGLDRADQAELIRKLAEVTKAAVTAKARRREIIQENQEVMQAARQQTRLKAAKGSAPVKKAKTRLEEEKDKLRAVVSAGAAEDVVPAREPPVTPGSADTSQVSSDSAPGTSKDSQRPPDAPPSSRGVRGSRR